MTAHRTKQASLTEDFAEACTQVARQLSGNSHLQWGPDPDKPGRVKFHCPLSGLLDEPHAWKGSPQAMGWIKQGQVVAWCGKCVGHRDKYKSEAEYLAAKELYTAEVKQAVRWKQDGVIYAGFRPRELRRHRYFDRDFKHAFEHYKVQLDNGETKWWWRYAELDPANEPILPWTELRSEVTQRWLAQHYPELEHLYEALSWFGIHSFMDTERAAVQRDAGIELNALTVPLIPVYRVVVTEGERDTNTFNRLMKELGNTELVATCLSHPAPKTLASQHHRLIAKRHVILIADADEAGRKHAEQWTRLVWDQVESVKLIREQLELDGSSTSKDLTDWVTRRVNFDEDPPEKIRAVAQELIDLLSNTGPLTAPYGRLHEWREGLRITQRGGISTTNLFNAKKVLTQHLELKDRLQINLHSGEVEIDDPPWGGGKLVGARKIAVACSLWLDQTEQVVISHRAFEEVLVQGHIIPRVNRMPQPGAWDGEAAINRMLTDIPLNAPPELLSILWAIFFDDLAVKLAGELCPQRFVLGVESDREIDLATAMLGKHAAVHVGNVSEQHLLDYARRGVALVQVSMSVVADQRRSLTSMSSLMTAGVYSRQLGHTLPVPLFMAVGPWPRTDRTLIKVDERCRLLRANGIPLLDSLAVDVPAALAEAVARRAEIAAMDLPDREALITLDEHDRRVGVIEMLRVIYDFAVKKLPLDRVSEPGFIRGAALRPEPLVHIVRDQLFNVMRAVIYDHWRDGKQQIEVFNAACRGMGWGRRNAGGIVSLTPRAAEELGLVYSFGEKKKINVPGIYLGGSRLANLEVYLNDFEEDSSCSSDVPPVVNAAESLSSSVPLQAFPHAECQNPPPTHTPRAHMCNSIGEEEPDPIPVPSYLEGEPAINRVKFILSAPGVCAIDFETWPPAPEWFADQLVAEARKAEQPITGVRERAKLEARRLSKADLRTACTLQLWHENGEHDFVRLYPNRAACRDQLQRMFAGRVAGLVAHNALFETEVLLAHGVEADIDCTLLAAKALYLVAVPEGEAQQSFSLAALVKEKFTRTRDKTIRDRDWRLEESLDDEARTYGLQDVEDCLRLWQEYCAELEKVDLLDGYRTMQQAILPTAALNLRGLVLDPEAHHSLILSMEAERDQLQAELDELCGGAIVKHGSGAQISTWILETVLGCSLALPEKPTGMASLVEFLRLRGGGLKTDPRLKPLKLGALVSRIGGLTVEQAARVAAGPEWGYIARPDADALLEALRAGKTVLTAQDRARLAQWEQDYAAVVERRKSAYVRFLPKIKAAAGNEVGWKQTETGHLKTSKGSKMRKAEQLREAYPTISRYLEVHVQWQKAVKLITAFGDVLSYWRAEDGRVRGQYRVWGTVTGRHTCFDPNLQQQPNDARFRALWVAPVAPARRKLVIADYSQIELRLLAIVAKDKRLMEVYREDRDVHEETAEIAGIPRKNAKNVNFSMAYGAGAAGMSEQFGFSLDHAQQIMARVLGAYTGLADYRSLSGTEARAQGYIMLRGAKDGKLRRVQFTAESPGTCAINYPIQGGAASVQMRALRLIYDTLKARPDLKAELVASVHDEIIVESPEDDRVTQVQKLLVDCMVQALLEIYPEAEEMGVARLSKPTICGTWAEKE